MTLRTLQTPHKLLGIHPILESFAPINEHDRDLLAILSHKSFLVCNVNLV
jgi:hypothetical protein